MSTPLISAELLRAILKVMGGPTYELGVLITDRIRNTVTDAPENEDLAVVRVETERQENEMRRLEAQARVAQEMAIASRISSAGEVQIEEFYEYAGEGKAGLSLDGNGATLGASGSGRRISKRVYKFTGTISANDLPAIEETELSATTDVPEK